MNDPILAAIRAVEISLLFSHPDDGRVISRLRPREVRKANCGIERSGVYLLYERDFVKSMTHAQLKAALLSISGDSDGSV